MRITRTPRTGGQGTALNEIVIALGSNLGDRMGMLDRACVLLERRGVRIVRRSRLYFTRPWGTPGRQAYYVNAAVVIRSPLRPLAFLWHCREVERRMGRVRRGRWASRTIDLDIISWAGLRIDHPDLAIPHASWSERDFVIRPLLDLAAALPSASRRSAGQSLLGALEQADATILHVMNHQKWSRSYR